MPQVDPVNLFPSVVDPDRERIVLRSQVKNKPPTKRWGRLGVGVAFLIHGMLLAGFLNYEGITHIPGLERFTRERLQAARPAEPTPPPRPTAPPVAPIRPGNMPFSGMPGAAFRPQPNLAPNPGLMATKSPSQPPRLPGAATEPAVDAAESAISEAETVLTSNGIVRASSAFVLRSEADAKAALLALRARASEFYAAKQQLQNAQDLLSLNLKLNDNLLLIKQHEDLMRGFPYSVRRGVAYHGNNNLENDQYNAIKADRDGLQRVRDTVLIYNRNQIAFTKPPSVEQGNERKKVRKEAADTALNALREIVGATLKTYDSLSGDPTIRKAIAKLKQGPFGPSRDFADTVRELGEAEKLVGGRPTYPVPEVRQPN